MSDRALYLTPDEKGYRCPFCSTALKPGQQHTYAPPFYRSPMERVGWSVDPAPTSPGAMGGRKHRSRVPVYRDVDLPVVAFEALAPHHVYWVDGRAVVRF